MKSIISKKRIISGSIAFILLSLIIVTTTSFATTTKDTYSEKEILQAQLERGKLQKNLEKNSIYPEYYVAENITNFSDTEIESGILENEALLWYANKNNITVSDKELNSFIEELLKDAKTTEEYDHYAKAAEELGTTYEDIVINDSEAYRDVLIKSKLYKQCISANQSATVTNQNIEDINKINEENWNSFVKATIMQYEKSPEYKKLRQELSICKKLSFNNVTEIKKIESAMQKK